MNHTPNESSNNRFTAFFKDDSFKMFPLNHLPKFLNSNKISLDIKQIIANENPDLFNYKDGNLVYIGNISYEVQQYYEITSIECARTYEDHDYRIPHTDDYNDSTIIGNYNNYTPTG